MRRKDREVIDLEEVTAVINACECCRLGFVDENEAYIVPLNFGFEIKNEKIILFFHCAKEGRKIDLIPKQKTISFEMDSNTSLVVAEKACKFSFLYHCVMGSGNLEILENTSDKIYGLNQIMKHYAKNEVWEYDQSALERICVLKLTVEKWSCKEH